MGILTRIRSKWQREASSRLARRPWAMRNDGPLISFTFDDFPASALHVAGSRLAEHGIAGTYYASFGLMGTTAPTGRIFEAEDVPLLFEKGHELGCHTYHHRHSYDTPPGQFEDSVTANKNALQALSPGRLFHSLAYPLSVPRPAIKRRCARHFSGSRAGGQVCNERLTDLDALNAFFLEQSRDDFGAVERVIAQTISSNGWLIFATHDVDPDPTPYGVKPCFFKKVVEAAIASGARLVPVSGGLQAIGVRLKGEIE